MKRRYLLQAIHRCPPTVVFAGFLWAATIACAGPGQAQTIAKPDVAASSQTDLQAGQNRRKHTPAQSSGWHHFGESNNTSVAGQSQPGAWQHFTPYPGTTNVGRAELPPRQDFGLDRGANLEMQMWALVNQDRLDPDTAAETGGRAQPLRWNENLAAVARAHSRDMLEQGYFDHVDPEGRNVLTRIDAAGIPWRAAGENIAIYGTVPGAEGAFMNEPRFQHNHRYNILNANYTDVGIGIVQGANGSLYVTQDFVGTPTEGGGNASASRSKYKPK